MRIVVIGAGISGMVAAYLLSRDHLVTVLEAGDYVGGHTNTIDVDCAGRVYPIDTGFIVFNERTYPNFIRLLRELNVPSHPTEMSFSVRCEATGLEYNGTSLNALFAQRRNLLRPSFYRMIRDVLRFNREALDLLESADDTLTLGDYLEQGRYSDPFVNHYIIPMGAAIWSAQPGTMRRFPARAFVRFFHNHGMLTVNDRPLWRVITGGSKEYVRALTRPFRDRVHVGARVLSVRRAATQVAVSVEQPDGRHQIRADHVIMATHSDQALALLADPTPQERDILGAIPYQENEAVLHTDRALLPRRRLAWASWNYHLLDRPQERVAVTYHMNTLQRLSAPQEFCVTLNHADAITPSAILRRIVYHHPVYTPAAMAAQRRHREINGLARTHYCGAYWGFGFHEDGVNSALEVCRTLQGVRAA